MAPGDMKKQPSAAQKAARKDRKRQRRLAAQASSSTTAAGTVPSDTIPGTKTRANEALQVRRWLLNERAAPLKRFSVDAINHALLAFDKKPATRAANPFAALSAEAKNVVAVVERERDDAKQAGVAGD
ncbi:MAG: hypothetical protein Q9216_001517, partial [Gyalolechia sp. 2 TL-2023]